MSGEHNSMNKFIFKFTLIFVAIISLMFFSLMFFQKYSMEKRHGDSITMQEETRFMDAPIMHMRTMPPRTKPQAPPIAIPAILIIGISSIFVFLVLRYIDRNFVKPLGIIENNVERIKEGLLDVEFKTDSENDKIIDTFNTMNGMVAGLKQREKLHDNFIRNLVHDLRAPVIAQERAMEILSEELGENALVEGMVQNNDAYLKMINSIIESFSQQDIKVEKMDFDFSKLTDTVIEALKPAADAKHIELRKSVKNNLTVWADYISVNRIVMNLVSNAIDNIENSKVVTIRALKNQKSTVIIIEDNGSGMSEEEQKKLFTKHIQRSNSENKSVSGMGLSIVYDLVVQNGGKIKVESKENEYTKFIIELENENKDGKV